MRNGCVALTAALALFAGTIPAAAADGGTKVWETIDEPEYASGGFAVTAAHGGGWLVTGSKDEMMFVRYLSDSGNVEWERFIAPGLLGLSAMAAADGGYLVTGQTGYYDPSVGVQGFVVKLNRTEIRSGSRKSAATDSIRRLPPYHGETGI